MNRELIDNIARAVLYEGYVLYPYRPSVKNRQRWTFGGVYPRAWNENQNSSDAWSMQTQCLLVTDGAAKLNVSVRFLHLIDRTILNADSHPVNSLEVAGKSHQPWQEAEERSVDAGEIQLTDLLANSKRFAFEFPARRTVESLENAGSVIRQQQEIRGGVEMSARAIEDGLMMITAKVVNETSLPIEAMNRDAALMGSFVSTHTIFTVENGEFISLIDPPEKWSAPARACENIGAWPVLVGEEPARDAMLASPIILYDYPQIAPESPGDLFDGTEIDEILSLRIMTLTDEEKKTAADVDPRVGELLKRTDSLAREQLMSLHGTVRGLRPVSQEQQP